MKARSKSASIVAGDGPILLPPREIAVDGGSHEVALHEFGEAVANAVAAVHEELARYPNSLGSYVVDEVEVTVPVVMRVNDLGQPLITVASGDTASANAAHIRFRVRPVLGACQAMPGASTLPLSVLKILPPAAIEALAARRVFSVEDLQRVARSPGGRAALENLNLGVPLEAALTRAAVLSLPLPPVVAESLIAAGVNTPQEFIAADPEQLVRVLNKQLPQPITVDHVLVWQERTGAAFIIPKPPPARPDVEVSAISTPPPVIDRPPAPPAAQFSVRDTAAHVRRRDSSVRMKTTSGPAVSGRTTRRRRTVT
jgi:hypothetical protein